jgi:hypothetical protein
VTVAPTHPPFVTFVIINLPIGVKQGFICEKFLSYKTFFSVTFLSLCKNLIPATYPVLNLDLSCINLQIAVSDGVLRIPIPLFVEHPVLKSVVILITFCFSTLSVFLELNKPVTNRFGTWRFPSIHTVDLNLANHVMHWFFS